MPKLQSSPRLDFDKCGAVLAVHDDVNLAVSTAPPAVDDGIPFGLEVFSRNAFAPPPEVVFVCHTDTVARQTRSHHTMAGISAEGRPSGGCGELRVADGEVARKLEFFLAGLFDVDVLERHDLDRLDEPIGAVDIPHPHIRQRQVEIEVFARFLDDLLNIVRLRHARGG